MTSALRRKFIEHCQTYIYPALPRPGLTTKQILLQFLIGLTVFIMVNILLTIVLVALTSLLESYFQSELVAYCMITIDLIVKILLIILFGRHLLPLLRKLVHK